MSLERKLKLKCLLILLQSQSKRSMKWLKIRINLIGFCTLMDHPIGLKGVQVLSLKGQKLLWSSIHYAFTFKLKLAKDLDVKSLMVRNDSQLFVAQVNGIYETKVSCLVKCLEKVKGFLEIFDNFKMQRILQSKNNHADSLTKLASMRTSLQTGQLSNQL